MKKTQAETGHKSKILIGVMILSMLFLVNFASSELFQFDNVKSYDAVNKVVTIKNTFGLGADIGSIKLNTPIHNVVGLGYVQVAEFEINSYEDYENILDSMRFYDIKDKNKEISIKYDFKIKVNQSYQYTNYAGKIITYYEDTWVDANDKKIRFDVKKGDYLIVGIFTTTNDGDHVEWIPSMYGKEISEFADYSAVGGTITTDGAYTVHTFTSTGTFNWTGITRQVEILVVAGGGGGSAGGGGAGGVNYSSNFTMTAGWHNITIGLGGAGKNTPNGVNGQNSSFDNQIVAMGGGGGGDSDSNGNFGGSGGGEGLSGAPSHTWGLGYLTQGNRGGKALHGASGYPAGGGGGCGEVGGNTSSSTIAGNGGNGCQFNISNGTMVWYAGGGGGGLGSSGTGGTGGNGGGGNGGTTSFPAINGTGGGGGGADSGGKYGGNGIVIIRYLTADAVIVPSVDLNSPANNTNTSTPSTTFNVSVHDYNLGGGVANVSLYIDGTLDQTNTSGKNNTYYFTKVLSSGIHNWSILAYNLNGTSNQTGIRFINLTIASPVITLNSPVAYFNTTNPSITLNATVTDNNLVQNVSLYIDGVLNETNATTGNNTYYFTKIFSEGEHYWSILSYDNESNPSQSVNRYFTIDTLSPLLSVTGITDLYGSTYPISLTWNLFNADPHVSNCWYYTSDDLTNRSVVCNSSTITNFTSEGSKTIYYFGNDTFGNQATGSSGLSIGAFSSTDNSDKSVLGDGDNVILTLYINGTNINVLYPETNATLWYNNTNYTSDLIDRTNQNYTKFTKTIEVYGGNSTGVKNYFNWSFNIKNSTTTVNSQTTSLKNVTVYSIAITDCSVLSGRYLLNLSIKDEKLNNLINASLNSTNIEIDLMLTSRANPDQTWNFSEQWTDKNFVSICVTPSALTSSSYKIDFTVGFKADGYVQEFYYMDNGTLDNTYYFNPYTFSNISLYDLESADSTTFLFKFKDEDNLEVDDAIIHVFRKYIGDGIFREVERAEQDNNGETHVHLVEEDVIYYFMITQYGHIIYTSSNYNAKCLSTPCQIELSASADFTEFPTDYNKVNGTIFTLTSSKDTRTVTLNYVSNASKVVNLSVFKVIDGSTISYINTTALTGTSGTLTLNIPLSSGNETFFASIFSDGVFVRSEWVDMKEKAQDYFGTTGAILGGLLVLTLIFMAISEGVVLIIIGVVAIVIIGAMQLVDLSWLAIISIICAGALIIWKLTQGGNKR